MSRPPRAHRNRAAFTAVEILIVVAAMAIMAGIVIPQVGLSIEQAKETSMLANLHMLTTAIERYKIDHEGLAPDILTKATLPQLFEKTDIYGDLDRFGEFGPYVLDRIPPNPLNGDENVYQVKSAPPASPQTKTGWLYFPQTGQIWAGEQRAQ